MKLRADVDIHDHEDAATVVDSSTGLTLVVSRELGRLLACLRADVGEPSNSSQRWPCDYRWPRFI